MIDDKVYFFALLILLPIFFIWALRRAKKEEEEAILEWKLLGSVERNPQEGIDYRATLNGIPFDFLKSALAQKRGVNSSASIAYYFLPRLIE